MCPGPRPCPPPPVVAAGRVAGSREHHEDVTELHRGAGPHRHMRDRPRPWRPQLVLHLHGLHGEQRLTGLDRVAGCDGHGHDPARDDGTYLKRPTSGAGCRAIPRGALAQGRPGLILDEEFESPAVDHDLDRTAAVEIESADEPDHRLRAGGGIRRRLDGHRVVAWMGGCRGGRDALGSGARSGGHRGHRSIAAARPAARHGAAPSSLRKDAAVPGSPPDDPTPGPPESAAPAATCAATTSASRRLASPSQCVSTQSVEISPRANAGSRINARSKGSVVWMPVTATSSSARRIRSMAVPRSGPTVMILAISGSSSDGTRSPARI